MVLNQFAVDRNNGSKCFLGGMRRGYKEGRGVYYSNAKMQLIQQKKFYLC